MTRAPLEPGPLIYPPDDPAEWAAWRKSLVEWREKARKEIDLSSYAAPAYSWMRDCAVCGMVMLFDEEFFDAQNGEFRTAAYTSRMQSDFGDLDAVVLWQAYPRIGIDSRNQFDHYRLAPKLKQAIEDLQRGGTRVFMGYNPWDTGTRREPLADAEAIAKVLDEFGFDGVFLDTLPGGSKALRNALDRIKPGVVMESELALAVEDLPLHHASWAQWLDDSVAPAVLRNKWLERRHTMHLVRRWDRDHSGELHLAWMNGTGVLVWENVFGSWVAWTDRDKSTLRSMNAIRAWTANFFTEGEWDPLVSCLIDGVYASAWRLGQAKLWTLVNRNDHPVSGSAFAIGATSSMRLFDLLLGVQLDHAHVEIPARGIGALVALPGSDVESPFWHQLEILKSEHERVNSDNVRTDPLPTLRAKPLSRLRVAATDSIAISAGTRTMVSRFRVRECGEYGSATFSTPYPALHGERRVEHPVDFTACAVETMPVSNGDFLRFVESGYRPANRESFLAHWVDGKPKSEDLDRPVTFVGLDDARAYARWAGKRLPTEYEWQDAAPPQCGVWNWTESEQTDGHTRFSILKGGCVWEAKGSEWYADSGPRSPDWSTKYIHWYPSLDRCETIGFRCATDL
ncbi:hypothetical protein EON81_00505 [bacterium]|nr:MAG: hypothetical protein EON81_00505 [bacterium]